MRANDFEPWPRLARYPVHWHHAGYVGVKGGYQDPSSVQSLSIHRSFSRFVTVHATHESIVKDCVGYDGVGHGYFLEDGYETENHIVEAFGATLPVAVTEILTLSERKEIGIHLDRISHFNGHEQSCLFRNQ